MTIFRLVAASAGDLGQLLVRFVIAFACGCVQKDARLIAASRYTFAAGIELCQFHFRWNVSFLYGGPEKCCGGAVSRCSPGAQVSLCYRQLLLSCVL